MKNQFISMDAFGHQIKSIVLSTPRVGVKYAVAHDTLGLILIRAGVITRDQLYAALRLQRQNSRLLGTCLLSLGYIKAETLLEYLSEQLGIPALPPGLLVHASPEAVRRVPADIAQTLGIAPYSFDGQMLGVAIADSRVVQHLEEVARHAQCAVGAYVALEMEIEAVLAKFYGHSGFREGTEDSRHRRDHRAADLGQEATEEIKPILLSKRKSSPSSPVKSNPPPSKPALIASDAAASATAPSKPALIASDAAASATAPSKPALIASDAAASATAPSKPAVTASDAAASATAPSKPAVTASDAAANAAAPSKPAVTASDAASTAKTPMAAKAVPDGPIRQDPTLAPWAPMDMGRLNVDKTPVWQEKRQHLPPPAAAQVSSTHQAANQSSASAVVTESSQGAHVVTTASENAVAPQAPAPDVLGGEPPEKTGRRFPGPAEPVEISNEMVISPSVQADTAASPASHLQGR
ncbi:MAG: hypothetical protein R3C68_07845 [Myxococcota bacterium]